MNGTPPKNSQNVIAIDAVAEYSDTTTRAKNMINADSSPGSYLTDVPIIGIISTFSANNLSGECLCLLEEKNNYHS